MQAESRGSIGKRSEGEGAAGNAGMDSGADGNGNTRAEVEAVLELVESVENRFELHADIQNIINEEAEGYFSGQMDLDSTVDKMQNRVSLLLQEAR